MKADANNEETQIKVFSADEILANARKESRLQRAQKRVKGYVPRWAKRLALRDSEYTKNVLRLWGEFRTQIISGVITAAIALGICLGVNALNVSLGYEVYVDGRNIGLVTDQSTVYDAINEVKADVKSYLGEEKEYEKTPVFVRRIVSNSKLASKDDLSSALLSGIDAMVECYAIYVSDEPVLGVASEEAAEWVLGKYKQKYTGGEITDDTVVDFCEKTQVKKDFLHIGLLQTPEDALETLSGGTKAEAVYTVQPSDTLWDIAVKYNTTVEHLLAMNENLTENIHEGTKVRVEESVPLLSVKSVQTVSMVESVPYTVDKIDDSTIYQGTTVVSREGKNGEAKVLAKITKINGTQTDKEILESETISAPVSRIEKVGTKERPKTTGSGSFIRPTYGSLSSRYGSRWGRRHTGIDIAGSYNSDIKAADGGVVTFSGWMSGYGNYVVVNHENGYQTAYGHCASLLVKNGDRVAKGDVIAKMGNTGRSTGTHLHFEVKKNGTYVDPLSYVGY